MPRPSKKIFIRALLESDHDVVLARGANRRTSAKAAPIRDFLETCQTSLLCESTGTSRYSACNFLDVPDIHTDPLMANVATSVGQVAPASSSVERAVRAEPKRKLGLYAAVAVAVAIGGCWWWSNISPDATASRRSFEATLPLETFVVNAGGARARAYLRVGITLGLSHPPGKKEEVPVALARDVILSVLANAEPEDLLGAEGKQRLKEEILRGLQERAPELGVENIYFTEFLVQM